MMSLSIGPVSIDVYEALKVVGHTIYKTVPKVKELYDKHKAQDFLIAIIDDFSGTRCADPFICAWGKVHTSQENLEQVLNKISVPVIYSIKHLDLNPKIVIEVHDDLHGFETDTTDLSEFDYIIK
jgi:hypothetical protein